MQATKTSKAQGGRTAGQRLTADLRAAVRRHPGLGECLQLCDTMQTERVCELVGEGFKARRLGHSHGIEDGLQHLLLAPLRRYLDTLSDRPATLAGAVRMEAGATVALIEVAERLLERLESGPWDDDTTQHHIGALEVAWHRWVAYVSSYWMWARVGDLLAATEVRKSHGSMGGKAAASERKREGEERRARILAEAQRLEGQVAPRYLAGVVARTFDCTPQHVRRVLQAQAAALKQANG